MNIQRATYFDAPKMNTQSKPNCKVESIGDIGLTKAETTLHIVTDAVPAKVFDKNDTLICFYAKQVMTAFDGTEITATKENQRHNEPTTVSVDNDVLAKAKENYWYFFSPLYFGESPVACMTSPQWQDGKGIIRIYTFKRMHSQQSVSNISGYFGGKGIQVLPVAMQSFSPWKILTVVATIQYRTNILAWISGPQPHKYVSILSGCL